MSNPIEKWFDNKRLSPVREFSQIQDSFDRLFNEFLASKKWMSASDFNFSPSCEVAEEENNYVLKFDLPGVTKENLKVEIVNDQLTVRAERKEEKKQEGKKKFMSEIYYGSYVRTFDLPGPVDEKKVDAKFENGVLTLRLPKTEALKAKQITVQ